jgi:diguanylate cyclase (GGDEF)-like protein
MPHTLDPRAGEFTANRLQVRYIVALSLIALLTIGAQWLLQSLLIGQEPDSRVVNIAGRQRMLSQKITKASLYLHTAESPEQQRSARDQLQQALDLWRQSHRGLQVGDAGQELPGNNSREVRELFAAIEPPFQAMVAAAETMISLPADARIADAAIHALIDHEPAFLAGMDAIVFRFDAEAKQKVDRVRVIEAGLAATTLLVLVLEAVLIFAPAVRRMRHDMRRHEIHEADLERLFASNPTPMFLVDSQTLEIQRGNVRAEALMACAPNGYVSHPLCEFLDTKFDANRAFIEKLRMGDPLNEYEVILLDAHRSVVEALASACQVFYEGSVQFVIGITNITEIKKAQQTLQYYATFDEMTGLVNRRTGLMMLTTEMGRARRDQRPLSVCFIDIDGLKDINDTHGHSEGDWMIKATAAALLDSIRDGDVAVRLGGDEFLLILHDCRQALAAQLFERIGRKLAETVGARDRGYPLTASFGICDYDPQKHLTPESLVEEADQRMYEDKHAKQATLGTKP